MDVQPAANMNDLSAAAAVRAASFNVYAEDRSEFSKQSHRKMTMDSEWNALQRKMNGEEPGYGGNVKVTCLLATTPVPEDEAVATKLQADIDPSCKLPAKDDKPPLMCVGSLDVNECEVFPSEDLMPLQMSNGAGRAYISNVCTTSGGRRMGIASKVRLEFCPAVVSSAPFGGGKGDVSQLDAPWSMRSRQLANEKGIEPNLCLLPACVLTRVGALVWGTVDRRDQGALPREGHRTALRTRGAVQRGSREALPRQRLHSGDGGEGRRRVPA